MKQENSQKNITDDALSTESMKNHFKIRKITEFAFDSIVFDWLGSEEDKNLFCHKCYNQLSDTRYTQSAYVKARQLQCPWEYFHVTCYISKLEDICEMQKKKLDETKAATDCFMINLKDNADKLSDILENKCYQCRAPIYQEDTVIKDPNGARVHVKCEDSFYNLQVNKENNFSNIKGW